MTLRRGDGENPAASVNCGFACLYTAEAIELGLKGGNPGEIIAKEEPLAKKTGLLCPATASWTANYTVQKPKPLDLSKLPTKLCKAAPEKTETTCPAGEEFSGEIVGALSKNVSIISAGGPGGTVTCTESPLKGKFNGNGTGEISSLGFSSNKGGECTSTLKGNPNVAVSMANLPAVSSAFAYFGLGKGLLMIEGKKNLELNLLIAGEKDACVYKLPGAELIITNPGAVMTGETDPWVAGKIKGPATCPTGIQVQTTWKIESNAGKNIWLAEK